VSLRTSAQMHVFLIRTYGSRRPAASARGLRPKTLLFGGRRGAPHQPAPVFRHIADLEREAGVKLVVCRSRRGVLIPAGEFLSNHILRVQALLAQAARGIGEFRQPTSGSMSIVASGVPGTYLLPEVMARSSMYARACA
jgi:hypothetical protein